MTYIKKNFFFLFVFIFVALTASATFYRFYFLKDYIITYEAVCDPYIEICFVGCEDDLCVEPFYYKHITRHAKVIFNICGSDISGCEEANNCGLEEGDCDIELCDPNYNECESINSDDEIDTMIGSQNSLLNINI